ncbi:hypothetical protein CWC18_04875 [Pseudoalteromonas aurantia]|uniref:Uncharacterized protein n=1 Tax=Pseudoalteromonas aurantia TaxID=43654 RepID=A0A5S3V7S3_9GAMM|nr:hypothetical protein [Pseudoalteromonas aurantia]TMO65400.1 hypothetical protein CWC18_04875 [Pseudoalteromonas aurantia]TMO67881.1 hypothetical protein CWC19_12395 [Pseudoalteromonas aurantia]
MKTYDDEQHPIMSQLKTWFKQKSVGELSEIILNYIGESAEEQSRWQLAMLNDQVGLSAADIKKMITKALPKKQVWSYSEASAYFRHSDDMFADIFIAIDSLPVDKQWQLVLHALVRLNTVLEQVDDSGGYRFDLEGELNQRLSTLFNQQAWSDDEKAQWIFDHYKDYKYDVFPSVPEDFNLTDPVKQIFVGLCETAAQQRQQQGVDLSNWQQKSKFARLIEPLIAQAQQNNDWQQQCTLMAMTAYDERDFISISQLCLDNKGVDQGELLDAEYWLQKAYHAAKNDREKISCQQFEVELRLALNDYGQAWQLAWQLFNQRPSFSGYKGLMALEKKTGVIDTTFKQKAEHIFTHCYTENSYGGIAREADALLSFYMYHQELTNARLWVKSHKAEFTKLLTLADLIVAEHPQEAIDLYARVVLPTISQGNNQAYQHATDLLLTLEKNLQGDHIEQLHRMIRHVIKQHKAKRNMMKLLKAHYSVCF